MNSMTDKKIPRRGIFLCLAVTSALRAEPPRRVSRGSAALISMRLLSSYQNNNLSRHEVLDVAHGVSIYEIDGPFFFGIATKFDEMMRSTIGSKPVVRVLRMRKVAFIDATALHNLEILIRSSQNEGIHVVLSGVRPNVRESLVHAGIDSLKGSDHICDHISKALALANRIAEESHK